VVDSMESVARGRKRLIMNETNGGKVDLTDMDTSVGLCYVL